MWNKDKREYVEDTPVTHREPESRLERREQERREAARPVPAPGPALIGRSISIKGEVTGDEDLLIQGRIEGSVDLKQHSVTVGPEGEVKASIVARVVTVEGKVEGNLSGEEQVVLRASARVQGDVAAPRVVLEDGTLFRGSVDMGENKKRPTAATAAAAPEKPQAASAPKPVEPAKQPAAQHQEPAKAKVTAAAGS